MTVRLEDEVKKPLIQKHKRLQVIDIRKVNPVIPISYDKPLDYQHLLRSPDVEPSIRILKYLNELGLKTYLGGGVFKRPAFGDIYDLGVRQDGNRLLKRYFDVDILAVGEEGTVITICKELERSELP